MKKDPRVKMVNDAYNNITSRLKCLATDLTKADSDVLVVCSVMNAILKELGTFMYQGKWDTFISKKGVTMPKTKVTAKATKTVVKAKAKAKTTKKVLVK